ncbi:mannitol dehydrogenase [bacterium 1XD21-13]|nr:mannitol dehydrogenase [bacterium 1XD21-13]
MKAVMYGAGNIGRGFIGMLFSASGYEVTFVDVAEELIEALNRENTYPVRIVSNEGFEDIEVLHVCAVNGKDTDAAATAIAEADIMATAVGVNILKYIVPNLTAGIRKRMQMGGRPLNIIICENLIDADKLLARLIKGELSEQEQLWFDENVGLVEASIGRMVPVQTEEMKAGNPLRICVEQYDFLPVDKAAFKGEMPEIKNMVPFEPFDFYIKRKLYVHNMGHAICAYLGLYTHRDYIFEAIDDVNIQSIVQNAMLESTMALTHKYHMPTEDLVKHFQNLLYRFTNRALKDTCKRVGADPKRKLSPGDRLIGASLLCLEGKVSPVFISIGTAGAVYEYIRENGLVQSMEQAEEVLGSICSLEKNHPLYNYVLPVYKLFLDGVSIREIRQFAESLRQKEQKAVI